MEHLLARVDDLTKQLVNLGYVPFQVERIIKDVVGTSRLEEVDSDQISLVIEALEEYVQFAIKCLKT